MGCGQVSAANNEESAAAMAARARQTEKFYGIDDKREANKIKAAAGEQAVEGLVPMEEVPVQGTQTVFIKQIKVTGESAILSADEVRGVTSTYENRDLTIAQLHEMIAKINALYRAKNQVTAKAILPPQKIRDGIVEIALVEGRIGTVTVDGNQTTRLSYITRRVDVPQGEVFDMSRVERSLFLFNRTHDVRLRAVLKPGSEAAKTDVTLQAAEPKLTETVLYTDNTVGTKSNPQRGGFSFTDRSLLGFRDQLTLGGVLSDRSRDGYFSYNVPVNAYGTRVSFSHENSRTAVRSGEMKALKVTGESRSSGVYVTQPLFVQKKYGVNLFGGYDTKASSTAYDGFTTLAQKLRTVTYGSDYTYFGTKITSETRNTFTNGVEGLNSDAKFFKFNNDSTTYVDLTEKMSGLLRGTFQYSDTHLLPAGEQFQLGGVGSVRGYNGGAVTGDNGYFLSAELSRALFDSKKVRGILFYDHGGIIKQKSNNITSGTKRDSISGTGFGFNVTFTESLSGRIYCGVPLDGPDRETAYQPVFHYDIQWKF
jgi:hemolysin activation/secretion protein